MKQIKLLAVFSLFTGILFGQVDTTLLSGNASINISLGQKRAYTDTIPQSCVIKTTKAHVKVITGDSSVFNWLMDIYTAKEIDYLNVQYDKGRIVKYTMYFPIALEADIREKLTRHQK